MPRLALVLASTALVAACGRWGNKEEGGGAPSGSSATGAGSDLASPTPVAGPAIAGAVSDWVDPEPAGAQAMAEQVLRDPVNQDKVTQLTMAITTLENRTSGIQGFATGLAPAGTSLDDRLTRLGAEVTGTEVTIRLPGSVLFDFDSAVIRADAQRTLTEVAEVVKGYAARPVRIEGHTDAVASDDYNQKLSERRAESVRAWLVAHGCQQGRLSTNGHGETRPVADNATVEGRQRNRRVEVIISKGS